jgi:hypothetical protein
LKKTQNRIAESRLTLPTVIAYAMAVWMVSGLLIPTVPITVNHLLHGAWIQLICFILSGLLIAELNNSHALIRIYSRMVSSTFIMLSCAAVFLFASMAGSIVGLCFSAFYVTSFRTYQNKVSMGWTYYAFLCIGLASTAFVHILFYIPLIWLLFYFQLASLSWRTFFASLLGLLTPYWFALPFTIYQSNVQSMIEHFMPLTLIECPFDAHLLTVNQLGVLTFVTILSITGIVHYWRNNSADKFRTRQLYTCFTAVTVFTLTLIFLQPQHFDMFLRILLISASPLIAHFIALTSTRITNIAFYVMTVTTVLLTILNLWMPSLTF